MSPPHDSNFCSQCGSPLDPDDSFCADCGVPVDGSRASHESTSAHDGFRRRVEDYTVDGWDVKYDYGDRVVMIDRGFGSLGVHVLLFLFTVGFGNLLYAWYSYSPGADRIELRADDAEQRASRDDGDADSDDAGLSNGAAYALSFFSALVGLSILGDASSLTGFYVGFAFVLVAAFVLPGVRDRLGDRRAVTTFGRVHWTDENVVRAPDVPCTACSRPVGTGVERAFKESVYVAGFPVSTEEKGENRYCRSCAQGDPFTGREFDGEAVTGAADEPTERSR